MLIGMFRTTRLFTGFLPVLRIERINVKETLWLGIAWLVFLIINLIASATKSAFTHVRLPWLLSLGMENQAKVDKTIGLVEKQGLRTALRLGLAVSFYWQV